MNYIHSFERDEYQLSNDLLDLADKFKKLIGANDRIPQYWSMLNPVRGFMKMMHNLERLFFNDFNNLSYNAYYEKNYNFFKDSLLNDNENIGFYISVSPKTRWQPIPNAVHLEVAEKTLKEYPSQFIKIFTINNKLGVYMNKQPTFNQIVSLKILQWTIFKNKIEREDSLIPELLNAFKNKDVDKSNEILNKIFSRSDLAELKLKGIIKVLEYGSTKKIRNIEDRIELLNKDLTQLENNYNKAVTDLNMYNTLLAALQANPNQETEPLIKYLAKHPYIKDIQAMNDASLMLYFEAPIVYYDKYILDTIKKNRSDTAKKILDIFSKDEYQLMTRCQIYFDTETFSVAMASIGAEHIIGHPHIDRFKCFGNHGMAIRESAKEVDYLGAIEQISQAVLNLNFSDVYVINEMLHLLSKHLTTYKTWKHKETGAMCTTKEVLEQYEETKIENE